jgi:hypothetical protein
VFEREPRGDLQRMSSKELIRMGRLFQGFEIEEEGKQRLSFCWRKTIEGNLFRYSD